MSDLQALDALFADHQDQWWDGFYTQRAKPVPFFVPAPDESLVAWLGEGRLGQGGSAIDLGCGHARNALYLARAGWSVQAVDFSAKALEWAAQRVAQAGVQLSLQQASVFEWEPAAGPVDLIVDSGLFHHLPPHRRAGYIERIVRWLKPGGCLVMSCFRPEGGSGLSDEQVYERRTLGGGLGYTEAQLRALWGGVLDIDVVRPMLAQPEGAPTFGLDFLWVMLAHKRL
ncbi:MAG: class I SAM-dependent methyltransferase [Ideonella sp. MAG2]|nr:MAG: class I SAM-dependent methyltransferase [Ideonella sp. MAG2]